MNRKHSFPVRCLAMLLALVLVLSNANMGLTAHAQAADESASLFELIAASDCGTKELNAILAYADALYNVNDTTVTYPAAPVDADAKLRLNQLKVSEVNGWVPYTYTVGTETKEFSGDYTVEFENETYAAYVTYQYSPVGSTEVTEALRIPALLAAEAAAQSAAMVKMTGNDDIMSALAVLDEDLIYDLLETVEYLDIETAGLSNTDYDENGVVDELDHIIAEKVLEEVKKEYNATITGLLDRMVVAGDRYYDIFNNRGKRAYEGLLRVYAILKEFQKSSVGLSDFYHNSADIIKEMGQLGETLYQLLGEYDAETKTYANASVVDALFSEMGVPAANAGKLARLADVMTTGASDMSVYTSYKTEIDLESENLAALCNALVACGKVSGYNTELYLYSKPLPVEDDTYKFVTVELLNTGALPYKYQMLTDAVVTQDDVANILTAIAMTVPHYDVDTAAVEALLGTQITENKNLQLNTSAKEYKLSIGGTDEVIDILGSDTVYVLNYKEGHTLTYKINGTTHVLGNDINNGEKLSVEIPLDMDAVAAGTFEIVLVEDDIHLVGLVNVLNEKLGAGSFELVEENGEYTALIANISMGDLQTFGMTLIEEKFSPVTLAGTDFITGTVDETRINLQALIDALVNDESFDSDKLIAMGEGKEDNLLTADMTVPGYELDFELNLTSVPSKMGTVSKGLNAIEDYFWFESNPAEDKLDINVNLPEKVYEAYLTAALATGYVSDDNVAELNKQIGMQFIEDYFYQLMELDIDENTLTNTLASVGINKDISAYHDYYLMVKKLANYSDFKHTINENNVDFSIKGDKTHIEALLDVLGLNSTSMDLAMGFVDDGDIKGNATVNIVNDIPAYQAVVVEPGKINDAGIKSKLNTVDYTTDLVKKVPTIGKMSAVMLLDNVVGDLNFAGSVILDLNGKTITGNVSAGGKLIIVDSAMDTYNGGKITGAVSASSGAIVGGTYGSDVSKFLKDGYIQDNGSVRNAVFYVDNGTYVLNADFYQLCDGYLPSVKALAVEIASELALNYYPAAALAYNGQNIYSLNIDSILNSYLGNGKDGAIDALVEDVLNTINVDGINTLANDIIDDLCDFKALSEALEANETLATYSFSAHPIAVEIVHVEETNTLDISVGTNSEITTGFSIGLKIEGENDYYQQAKALLAAMAEIVTVEAEVELNQPTYDASANDLTVSGSASADVVIDLSKDINYTKAMAIILAYGNPEHAEELMSAKNCVVELNKLISEMTVEEVITALKKMSRNVSMADMAEKVGYQYNAKDIADLEQVYHVLLCGVGKVLEKLEITGSNKTLAAFADGEASYTIDAYNKSADKSFKGYTGIFEVDAVELSLTIKLATKCDKIIGDVNSDGIVNVADASLLQRYCTDLCDETALHLCVADVTGDGSINVADASMIQRYATELIDSFPAEAK